MTPFFIIGFVLILLFSLHAQRRVKSAFNRFAKVPVDSGLTGAQTAKLITLPVEFDVSRRANLIPGEMGIIRQGGEAAGVNKVLDSAALPHVAAFVASLFQLIRLWLMMQSGRSRD